MPIETGPHTNWQALQALELRLLLWEVLPDGRQDEAVRPRRQRWAATSGNSLPPCRLAAPWWCGGPGSSPRGRWGHRAPLTAASLVMLNQACQACWRDSKVHPHPRAVGAKEFSSSCFSSFLSAFKLLSDAIFRKRLNFGATDFVPEKRSSYKQCQRTTWWSKKCKKLCQLG